MKHVRIALIAANAAALAIAGLTVPAVSASPPPTPVGPPSSTLTDWARIALSTVYPARSVPDGALYLGFTSLAVHDAVLTAKREHPQHGWVSARAAAAVAAHDVLLEYFPTAATALNAHLASSLGSLRDGPAKAAGIAIGQVAADDMIASRVGDGRNNAAITYTKAPAIGIWRPTPPNNAPMALPWLGHVKPLLLTSPTEIVPDGHDALTSAAYATDYNEVRTTGALTGSTRTAAQTTTAKFWNDNVHRQLQTALLDMLDKKPLGVVETARLLALVNAGVADGLITTWRIKLDDGFWRPLTAIRMADQDGNTGTTLDLDWLPLADTVGGSPPYPEYPSGHATAVNAFTEALKIVTGTTATDLTIFSAVTTSTKQFSDLGTLSDDAFLARIWLGIHFRDAMEDARYVGQQAVRIADQRLP